MKSNSTYLAYWRQQWHPVRPWPGGYRTDMPGGQCPQHRTVAGPGWRYPSKYWWSQATSVMKPGARYRRTYRPSLGRIDCAILNARPPANMLTFTAISGAAMIERVMRAMYSAGHCIEPPCPCCAWATTRTWSVWAAR
jgi:hypothetical protein